MSGPTNGDSRRQAARASLPGATRRTVRGPQRPPVPAELSPARRRAVLGVVAVALMMVVSAVSGLNVALPELARDTGASQSELTWIVDAYTVVFAGLLLTAGALGDRYGRRGMLLAGLVVFGAAATWALTLDDPSLLVAARALMGVGAAAVMPTTLSVITTSFPPAERGRAVGVWVGVAGGGAVLGLFASGVLLEFYSWSSFFGLNIALAALALVGTLAVVPNSRDAHPPRLDALGALLSLVGVSALVFAVIEASERGLGDPVTVTAAVVAAVVLVGFVVRQLHVREPLLDVRLFALRGFGAGSVSVTAQFFAAFGFFFLVIQYLQFVVGRSPLAAALTLLPLPLVLLPTARLAPRLADRWGTNRVGATGLVSLAVGLLVVSRLGVDFDPVVFYAGLFFFALGMGLAGTPATTAITASLPPSKQGVASAVNDVSRELGSALGIAVLGSLLTRGYRDGIDTALDGLSSAGSGAASLPAPLTEAVRSSIAAVTGAGVERLGPQGAVLAEAAKTAFVDGTSTALITGAVVLVAAAVFVAVRAPRAGQLHPGREPGSAGLDSERTESWA